MIANNKLDKSFGPVGTSAGMILFFAGLVLSCFYFSGLILVLIGGFVGFTSTSALIDDNGKRVKFCNNLFGIVRTGKWIPIEPSMKIGIKESNQTYRAFSRGNRALDITKKDYRVILFDSGNREIMPLKRTDSLEAAKLELETMGNHLGLNRV
jgi:hypothetical protein